MRILCSMKFTINTKEFKSVMSLVQTLADKSATACVVAHKVCLLRAFPAEKKLLLEFCLNGSFLSYTFEDVKLEVANESVEATTRSVDLGSLSSLKFSGATINITLGKSSTGNNTLGFQSGRLKGKLILSHADIEKDVEMSRPTMESVELEHTFSVRDFLAALAGHNYGFHRNAEEAKKRPVRIYSKKDEVSEEANIFFVSKDRLTGAITSKPMTTPYKAFDFYILPKPLQAILTALSQTVSPVFHFGVSKDKWRLHHGQIDVWFPNIIQQVNFELAELKNLVDRAPCFSLKAPLLAVKSAMDEITPFTSATHLIDKSEMPVVKLTMKKNTGYLSLNTSKAKDVIIEIEDSEFTTPLTYDEAEFVGVNFKYLTESISSTPTPKKKKEGDAAEETDSITIKWWPYQDQRYPTRGKSICVSYDNDYYWLSRIKEQTRIL
jgi:hypothetical protein